MTHRAHLTSLRFASAIKDSCIKEYYGKTRFRKDLFAGITVGIIAIPLSMALAIASGAPPQNGLYTAIFAGFIIALTGGSRFSISGPTAAFIVILYPVTQKFGLGGLLVATLMAGLMLVAMAWARLGRLLEYIPESVTLGFTAGIAVVIATLQFKDFLGLSLDGLPESYLGKVIALGYALPSVHWPSALIAVLTLITLIVWPRFKIAIPGHLPAVLIGVAASQLLMAQGYHVDTIASRFSYVLADGTIGQGIPPIFPVFIWPWEAVGPDGGSIDWSWQMIESLLPAAFSIAMLGAIESLLCAVVLDGMSGKRHNANGELMGQGLGNLIAPFFGGITATAALARSAANYRAGAESPLASVIHSLFVLLSLVLLASWLAVLPMASMAAMLMMVAWNMSEAHKVKSLLKKAPMGDVLTLVVCFSLTVLFDMVVAITFGIVVASLLFMRDISEMTKISDMSLHKKHLPEGAPDGWLVLKISGPLFFAAADRVFAEIVEKSKSFTGVVLYMDGVPIIDAGGLAALSKFIELCRCENTTLIIADLQFQPLKTLARAEIVPITDELLFTSTLEEALQLIKPANTQEVSL